MAVIPLVLLFLRSWGFNRWRTGYAFSWANVSDPNFDALRNQAVAAPTVAQAQAFVIQGNQYMVQQHWAVCLDTPNYFSIYQPWLHGYKRPSLCHIWWWRHWSFVSWLLYLAVLDNPALVLG